ncbi:MAG: LPS export ABC transporter permease LptG [Gammaproteobacteria bacterium]|nr:LPS export ABC transporter permease LptG [Gammaproteobacteria bacterium]MDH3751410.1 LPS export ABC transporter permease LptG [Gammaproteobacteria bacterium]MDH3805560.1 LPS export ABC transporter permease LptG [Gammaproteobacteria bacterium]
MNGILSQYMMRTILAMTALVLVVLLALAGLFEFIAELDDTQGDYQTSRVVLYTALRLPQLASEMLPVAALIGSLLGLGALAANSEIIVMRSSGLSIRKLSGMVAITGFVLLVFTGLLGEFIGPPLDYFARNMRLEARFEQDEDHLGNATWVRDGPVILHLERVSSEFEFGSIYVFRLDEHKRLASIARAENSGIDNDDRWILENLHETRFEGDGVQVVESSVAVASFDIDAEVLGISLVKPQSLSGRGLLSYVAYLKRNSLDSRRYETELWYRIARTATVMIMPVLALAFVFGSLRTGGAGGRLMIGVAVGLAYYLASEMLANSGQVFNFDPAVIAWLPSAVLAMITIFALSRIR